MNSHNQRYTTMPQRQLDGIRDILESGRDSNHGEPLDFQHISRDLLKLVDEINAAFQEATGESYSQKELEFCNTRMDRWKDWQEYRRDRRKAEIDRRIASRRQEPCNV